MPVASITSLVGDHGVYAVFLLMVAAAVVPAASELVMIYAGAVAGGAFASAHVVLFGHHVSGHGWAYLTMALVGTVGNLVGAAVGWGVGSYGGRPFLERHGRWLHVTPKRIDRAERWFARFGPVAVPLGLATPIVRSFVAIPAGIARMPLPKLLVLALPGCAGFCFGLAAGGWALGASYDTLDSTLRYVGVAAVVAIVAGAAVVSWRWRRLSRLGRRAEHPSR